MALALISLAFVHRWLESILHLGEGQNRRGLSQKGTPMTASQLASQQSELQELASRLSTVPPPEKLTVLSRMIALDAASVDCQVAVPPAQSVPDYQTPGYIKARRFLGVLNENSIDRIPNLSGPAVQAILADFDTPDPLITAIAVRHAGRLANDDSVERLVPVVQRGAVFDDPYVRKAAALAILNLHQTKASYINRFKLGPTLRGLVEDSNLNVAANAVAALTEINSGRVDPLFVPTGTTVNNLLAAIDQATEWSQVEILDFVATYRPQDVADARGIIARVISRLSHANPAVVLSAVRCCLQMNSFVDNPPKCAIRSQKLFCR
jgi:hypothetical protein